MSENSAKTLTGVFVLGALALAVTFVILLGSGSIGEKNPRFSLFFSTSLKGLITGSPVYFKGIRIGKVDTIQIMPDRTREKFVTPVVIEIEKNKATTHLEGGGEADMFENYDRIKALIDAGLRAQLGMTSILTGQLCIELDILPKADRIDPKKLRVFHGAPEIPTALTSLDTALSTLEEIPMQEIIADMTESVRKLSTQLQNIDLTETVGEFRRALDGFSEKLNLLPPLAEQAQKTMASYSGLADTATKDIHDTLHRVDGLIANMDTLSRASTGTVAEAKDAMTSLRRSSDSARSLLAADSAPMLELGSTLEALKKAAQTLSELAAALDIKPNSLIFGRNEQ